MGIGIAFAGGGIRGIAHVGVLKALEENNIKVAAIAGTSAGSIIATLYAMGYSPYYIYLLFLSCKRYFLFLFAPSIITSSISVKIALVRAGLNPIYFAISLVFDRPF